MTFRIVFMGSPEFALPSLRALAAGYNVVGVVTQPDRPAGRGRALTPPAVKVLAQELVLPVIQPERLKEPAAMQQLQEWAPDAIVVAAFGQILRPAVLNMPPFGCVNVHASLLPRWRGATPVQAAILNNDAQTGVTIMRMDPGVDTGPVLAQRLIPILPTDTGVSLGERLASLGADLLMDTLPGYLHGEITPRAQDEQGATYAPMLKKDDGRLDFCETSEALARRVRAFNPWPGAYTAWIGQILKVHRAHAVGGASLEPGMTAVHAGLPAVACKEGWLVLDEVQPAGKRPMSGEVYLHGAREWGSRPAG